LHKLLQTTELTVSLITAVSKESEHNKNSKQCYELFLRRFRCKGGELHVNQSFFVFTAK